MYPTLSILGSPCVGCALEHTLGLPWHQAVKTAFTCFVQVLNTDFSPQAAAACMNRLAKLSARFIGNRGFSIGIDDVTPAPRLVRAKQKAIEAGYSKVQGFIADFSKGQLQLVPGCNQEESLEHSVTGVLNQIRQDAADVGTLAHSPNQSLSHMLARSLPHSFTHSLHCTALHSLVC